MIDEALTFLKNRLNNYLSPDESQPDKVVFLEGQKIYNNLKAKG